MHKNNLVLNRLFTQYIFRDLIHNGYNSTYSSIVKKYIQDYIQKDNSQLICELYKYMSTSYRNEYIYQNNLVNKLLLGKHSINTTTALTQIPINKSKADFILINGKAVVYEIKTELDTFDRLETQIKDYFKAFNHVCVVSCEENYDKLSTMLGDSPVGIYILTKKNTLSMNMRKEPLEYNGHLDHVTIFKILRKKEYENIVLKYYGKLPQVTPVFYFNACLEYFRQIPIEQAYTMVLNELKKRNQIIAEEYKKVPYELKSLVYFFDLSSQDYKTLNIFLNKTFRG